jgi:hypothetical protein
VHHLLRHVNHPEHKAFQEKGKKNKKRKKKRGGGKTRNGKINNSKVDLSELPVILINSPKQRIIVPTNK